MSDPQEMEQQFVRTLESAQAVLKIYAKSFTQELAPLALRFLLIFSIWQISLGLIVLTIYSAFFNPDPVGSAWLAGIAMVGLLLSALLARFTLAPRKQIVTH